MASVLLTLFFGDLHFSFRGQDGYENMDHPAPGLDVILAQLARLRDVGDGVVRHWQDAVHRPCFSGQRRGALHRCSMICANTSLPTFIDAPPAIEFLAGWQMLAVQFK